MKAVLTTLVGTCLLASGVAFADKGKKGEDVEPYYGYKVENFEIKEPIGDKLGSPDLGRRIVWDQKTGNCIACHMLPIEEAEFPGQIGPPLIGVGSRYTEGQIRLRVVNEKEINPMTIMPGYYRDPKEFNEVKKQFRGKTVLTAQQVEDVVAYLMTLK